MKNPGSSTVHVVDSSGHCNPGWARLWHDNGSIDFSVLSVPGALMAQRGVKYEHPEQAKGHDYTPNTWHHDCPNSE